MGHFAKDCPNKKMGGVNRNYHWFTVMHEDIKNYI